MRVLIVSDTHGRNHNLSLALDKAGQIDMLIHLGDVEHGEDFVRASVDCPVHMVAGNNDFFSELPLEEEFMIGDLKVLITHGHNYYVSLGPERLKEEGKERGVDIVMFGHTHKPYIEVDWDITVANPGSLSYPRQQGRKPSYMLMDLDEKGKPRFEILYL
mgnify:CR=1 FL=1